MTKDKDFKKLVRSRMTATGENYTTARQTLLDSANSATNPAIPNAAEAIDQSVLRFRTKTLKTFMSVGPHHCHPDQTPSPRRPPHRNRGDLGCGSDL